MAFWASWEPWKFCGLSKRTISARMRPLRPYAGQMSKSGQYCLARACPSDKQYREGARFSPGCTGSAVWAGHVSLDRAHSLQALDSPSGVTMRSELQRIGYLGSTKASHTINPLSAHFELHIEQHRRLEDAQKQVGIVTKIQGIRWYDVKILGRRAHGGSTPMAARADALIPAAKLAVFVQEVATANSAIATVGVLNIDRSSSNTVPGQVSLTIDMRHPSESTLEELEQKVLGFLKGCADDNSGYSCAMERMWHSPAVDFDPVAVECARRATEIVARDSAMDLMSFAGHDSALTAMQTPTAMIFVPSKDGVSHTPEEFTSQSEW